MKISQFLSSLISFFLWEFFWFGIFFIVSYLMCIILFRKNLGPFNTILNAIGFVGVIIHELAHYLMCVITRTPAGNITVHYRDWKGRTNPHGSVELKEVERLSFLAALFVALAPLLVCFWLFMFLLDVVLNNTIEFLIRIISGILCISCLIGAKPSRIDFKQITTAFHRDHIYAFYQIFLFLISASIVLWITIIYEIILLNFVYYIFIGIFYILIFYIIKGVHYIFSTFGKYKNIEHSSINFRAYTKRRLRPKRIKDEKPDGLW